MPGPAEDTLDGQLGSGGGTPDEQAQLNAAYANMAGSSTVTSYVPWLGSAFQRSRDIKGLDKKGNPLPASPNQADERDRQLIEAGQALGHAPRTSDYTVDESDYMNPEARPDGPHSTPADQAADDAEMKGRQQSGGAILRDANEAALDVYNWSPETYADIARQMANVGMIDAENYTRADVLDAWKQLVKEAVEHHIARPNDLFTPLDMLDINHGNGEGSDGSVKKIDPVKVVNKSVQISTNEEARNLLRGMLATKLGRKPTAMEVDDFQAALNEAQRANPTVTTSTSYFNAAGQKTSGDSFTSGGLDSNAFAEDQTDWRDPDSEYGRYQAATTYYNAMMGAIRGPGGAVNNA